LIIATGAAMIDSSNKNARYIDQDLVEQMVDEAVEGVDLQIGKPSRRRYSSSHRTGNGKRIRVQYDHVRAYNSIMADYLGPVPIFNDRQFERVFRITKNRTEFIISNLAKYDSFWTHTHDAVGKPSISPHVKFLAAQKKLCYGISFSAFQDYLLSTFKDREGIALIFFVNAMQLLHCL